MKQKKYSYAIFEHNWSTGLQNQINNSKSLQKTGIQQHMRFKTARFAHVKQKYNVFLTCMQKKEYDFFESETF